MAPNYKEIARDARLKVLDLIYKAQTSHIGSNFSAIDIFTVLFEKVDPSKDEVVLSAGWKAAAWYYFLHRKGIITEEELNSFCMEGSEFIGLVEPMDRWGLRFAGGSMSMGLPFAVGCAMAKKLNGEEGTVYCVMSDGELQAGTIWEAAQIAYEHRLDNLVVILDRNGLQAMGKVNDILQTYWPHKGWEMIETDGHNHGHIEHCFNKTGEFRLPYFIESRTTKGKGVSFMENNNLYHYKALSDEEYQAAKQELHG